MVLVWPFIILPVFTHTSLLTPSLYHYHYQHIPSSRTTTLSFFTPDNHSFQPIHSFIHSLVDPTISQSQNILGKSTTLSSFLPPPSLPSPAAASLERCRQPHAFPFLWKRLRSLPSCRPCFVFLSPCQQRGYSTLDLEPSRMDHFRIHSQSLCPFIYSTQVRRIAYPPVDLTG
jgi:hypothetical protein